MLLRFFKGTGPGVIFFIIIILITVWLSAFLNPRIVYAPSITDDPMPLYRLLKLFTASGYLPGVVISFLLVSLMAFLLVDFNTEIFFINERTFHPAFSYILLGGLFPENQLLNPALPASLFLILGIKKIMDGYRKSGVAYSFFDASVLISTGSLFYANLIWFALLVIIGIILLRPGSLKETGLSVLGLAAPYLIAFGIYYVAGKDLGALLSTVGNNFFGRSESYIFSGITLVVLSFTAVLIIITTFFLFTRLNTKKIKSRQTFSLLIWTFLIVIVVFAILPSVSVEIIWLMNIPASYFLAHYFVFVRKKFIPELLFSLFLMLILLMQIWYLK
jgi:hypothetical protein